MELSDLESRIRKIEAAVDREDRKFSSVFSKYAGMIAVTIAIISGVISLYGTFIAAPAMRLEAAVGNLDRSIKEYVATQSEQMVALGANPEPMAQAYAQSAIGFARSNLLSDLRAAGDDVYEKLDIADLAMVSWMLIENSGYDLAIKLANIADRKAVDFVDVVAVRRTRGLALLMSKDIELTNEGERQFAELFAYIDKADNPNRLNAHSLAFDAKLKAYSALRNCDSLNRSLALFKEEALEMKYTQPMINLIEDAEIEYRRSNSGC